MRRQVWKQGKQMCRSATVSSLCAVQQELKKRRNGRTARNAEREDIRQQKKGDAGKGKDRREKKQRGGRRERRNQTAETQTLEVGRATDGFRREHGCWRCCLMGKGRNNDSGSRMMSHIRFIWTTSSPPFVLNEFAHLLHRSFKIGFSRGFVQHVAIMASLARLRFWSFRTLNAASHLHLWHLSLDHFCSNRNAMMTRRAKGTRQQRIALRGNVRHDLLIQRFGAGHHTVDSQQRPAQSERFWFDPCPDDHRWREVGWVGLV